MNHLVSLLTTNDVAVAGPECVVSNVRPAMVRNDTMEGRDFVVVPMVMITEGVHRGSNGSLLYTKNELAKLPGTWNGKPVVVNHPEIQGRGVSACSPEIYTTYKVGVIMNAKLDTRSKPARLLAEAWLEEDRVNKIDKRILNAIEKGQMMEVSTGLFSDNEMVEGEHGTGVSKKKYGGIVKNIRPDHLAILPDKRGACSIADGAGFLRNAFEDAGVDLDKLDDAVTETLERLGITNWNPQQSRGADGRFGSGSDGKESRAGSAAALAAAEKAADHAWALSDKAESAKDHGKAADAHNKAAGLQDTAWSRGAAARHREAANDHMMRARKIGVTINELSYSDISNRLSTLLRAKHQQPASPIDGKVPYCDIWVQDVYADYCVYSYKGKSWSQDYKADKKTEKVTLVGAPVEVMRTTEYIPVANNKISRTRSGTQNQNHMDKEQLIEALIGNEASGWTEDDRDVLSNFSEEKLQTFVDNVGKLSKEEEEDDDKKPATKKGGKATANEDAAAKAKAAKEAAAKATANDDAAKKSTKDAAVKNGSEEVPTENVEDYIAKAPPAMRSMLRSGILAHNQEKARLIQVIVANKANKFSEEFLNNQELEMLEGLAELAGTSNSAPAGKPKSKYFAQGAATSTHNTDQTDNAEHDAGPVLESPVMNFDEPISKKK